MSITGTVLNNSVKLPVPVPDGTQVEIRLPDPEPAPAILPGSFANRYAKYAGAAEGLPEDFAVNHDHYLHGAPKQE